MLSKLRPLKDFKSLLNSKFLLPAIVLLSIPLTVLVAQQTQDLRQRADEKPTITVSPTTVYSGDTVTVSWQGFDKKSFAPLDIFEFDIEQNPDSYISNPLKFTNECIITTLPFSGSCKVAVDDIYSKEGSYTLILAGRNSKDSDPPLIKTPYKSHSFRLEYKNKTTINKKEDFNAVPQSVQPGQKITLSIPVQLFTYREDEWDTVGLFKQYFPDNRINNNPATWPNHSYISGLTNKTCTLNSSKQNWECSITIAQSIDSGAFDFRIIKYNFFSHDTSVIATSNPIQIQGSSSTVSSPTSSPVDGSIVTPIPSVPVIGGEGDDAFCRQFDNFEACNTSDKCASNEIECMPINTFCQKIENQSICNNQTRDKCSYNTELQQCLPKGEIGNIHPSVSPRGAKEQETITVLPSSIKPGDSLTISWANIVKPRNASIWVFRQGEDTPYRFFKEIPGWKNGTTTDGPPISESGTYTIWLREANDQELYEGPWVATSNPFVVLDNSTPTPVLDPCTSINPSPAFFNIGGNPSPIPTTPCIPPTTSPTEDQGLLLSPTPTSEENEQRAQNILDQIQKLFEELFQILRGQN